MFIKTKNQKNIMVFEKIRDMFTSNDERYEVLYYKYSKVKLDNSNLKKRHQRELDNYKNRIHSKMANHLIDLFQAVETAKTSSFKVKATDVELQKLLMDINKVEKDMKKIMIDFSIEEVVPAERMFDPELHEIASYQDAKGMAKGLIMKTSKKGFKYKNEIIKKPRVVVTK